MQRGKIKTPNEEICLLGGTRNKIAFLTLSKGEGAGVALLRGRCTRESCGRLNLHLKYQTSF